MFGVPCFLGSFSVTALQAGNFVFAKLRHVGMRFLTALAEPFKSWSLFKKPDPA